MGLISSGTSPPPGLACGGGTRSRVAGRGGRCRPRLGRGGRPADLAQSQVLLEALHGLRTLRRREIGAVEIPFARNLPQVQKGQYAEDQRLVIEVLHQPGVLAAFEVLVGIAPQHAIQRRRVGAELPHQRLSDGGRRFRSAGDGRFELIEVILPFGNAIFRIVQGRPQRIELTQIAQAAGRQINDLFPPVFGHLQQAHGRGAILGQGLPHGQSRALVQVVNRAGGDPLGQIRRARGTGGAGRRGIGGRAVQNEFGRRRQLHRPLAGLLPSGAAAGDIELRQRVGMHLLRVGARLVDVRHVESHDRFQAGQRERARVRAGQQAKPRRPLGPAASRRCVRSRSPRPAASADRWAAIRCGCRPTGRSWRRPGRPGRLAIDSKAAPTAVGRS